MHRHRGLALGITFASLFALASVAHAQPSSADKSAAQGLFRDGRALMNAGKVAEACPKFAQSDTLDPQIGTHLNLALCHEAEGKTASAWLEFGETADLAGRANDTERGAFAREHVEALEKKLSRVSLHVEAPAAGESLKVDGHAVAQAAWGVSLPLDAGPHAFEATAPGKKTWKQTLDVRVGPATLDLAVPTLADALSDTALVSPAVPSTPATLDASPARPETPADVGSTGGGRTAGYVLAGVGVAGIALGSIFGVMAISQNSKADDNCKLAQGRCNQDGFDAGSAAKTDALVSTIGFGVGLAGLAAGAYFLFTSKPASSTASAVHVIPSVGSNGGGVAAAGRW